MEPATTGGGLVVDVDPVEAHSAAEVPTRAFECRLIGSIGADPRFDD